MGDRAAGLMSDEVPLGDLAYAAVRITDAAGGPARSAGAAGTRTPWPPGARRARAVSGGGSGRSRRR
ncbi:hypothetical protein [Actinomadura madurae]|uniref:hypothetical protein n=1 Tax=Actinomadura madurae TaxID=1993 RepID=UPI003FD80B6C